MKLMCVSFITDIDLAKFVNKCGIEKEDIQSIVSPGEGVYTLYYWSK